MNELLNNAKEFGEATKEMKLKVFEKYLKRIRTNVIREFTEFAILDFPEYFWTLPASTTGLFHGKGETLIDHIIGCLDIAEKVCDGQFKNHWTQRQKDQLISALILHDGWRCGPEDNINRITKKMIDEKDLNPEFLGNPKTTNDHPEIGYRQLVILAAKFNKLAAENKTNQIGNNNLSMILKAVRFHDGPWLQVPGKKQFSLSWPYDSVVVQTHNIDYHQRTAMMCMTRGERDES